MTIDTQKTAEALAAYFAAYNAMVAEGERLAKARRELLGDWQPDTSKFVTLGDYKPAHTNWRAKQSDSPTIIRALLDVIQVMGNALAFYVEGDNPAREAFARAVPLMNLKGEG